MPQERLNIPRPTLWETLLRGKSKPRAAVEPVTWRGLETLEPRMLLSADAPMFTALSLDQSDVHEGDAVVLSGEFDDPNAGDTHDLTIEWGDGIVETVTLNTGDRTFAVTHVFADDNPTATAFDQVTVHATISDGTEYDTTHPPLTNGSFETGDYSGWTLWETGGAFVGMGTWGIGVGGTTLDIGDDAFDYHDGVVVAQTSPGLPLTFSPTDGNHLAFQLQNGPQEHRLSQEVFLTRGTTTLTWDMAYRNHMTRFDANQQLAVHVRDMSDAILETLFVTADADGDPLNQSMASFTADLSAHAGSKVILDVELINFKSFFDVQLDNFVVSDIVTAPSLTVRNVDPIAATFSIGATDTDENGLTTLTGSFDDPGTGDVHTLDIDWGDGTLQSVTLTQGDRSFSLTHQYLDDNASDSYTIGATLNDDDGGVASTSTSVTVRNVAPVLAPLNLSSTALNENGSVTLSGSFTDPGTLDTHTLSVDWGDGTVQNVAVTPGPFSLTHQYLDDDPTGTASDNYTINVTVTDDDAGTDSASASVTVNNVAPSGLTLSAPTVNENGVATIVLGFVDPGTADVHTVDIDWGDGSLETVVLAAGTRSANLTHQYLDDDPTGTSSDTYTVNVALQDDDTGSTSASTTVTVDNVAPHTLSLSAPAIGENQTATLSGSFVDAGSLDAHTVTVDWGDGVVENFVLAVGDRSFSFTHAYPDDDPTATPSDNYNIQVSIADDDGGVGNDSVSLTVSNINPVLLSVNAPTVDQGEVANLSGSFSDAGPVGHTHGVDRLGRRHHVQRHGESGAPTPSRPVTPTRRPA